jgi:hypothetical protein
MVLWHSLVISGWPFIQQMLTLIVTAQAEKW